MYRVQSSLKVLAKCFILVLYAFVTLSLFGWPTLSSTQEVAEVSKFDKPVQVLRFVLELPTVGKTECFYKDGKLGSFLRFKYASKDWQDVHVVVRGPDDYQLQFRKQYGVFETDVTKAGQYSYCITRMSDWSKKVEVWFTFIETPDHLRFRHEVYRVPEKYRDMWESQIKIARSMRRAENVHWQVNLAFSLNDNHMKSNAHLVLYWSVGESVLIVLVAITQVGLLRCMLRSAKPVYSSLPTPSEDI